MFDLSHAASRLVRLAAATLALAAGAAFAQSTDYPTRAIKIVVPYPPGGFNDTLGRLVANKLSTAWKQPVVVENKAGGNTVIGSQAVAAAAPDGYTLLVVQFPFAANPWLYKNLPYDTQKAFDPVILAGRAPMMLVAGSHTPYKTVADVIAAAKAKPGALNYGSSGSGSSNHLGMAYFEMTANVKMTQVPYKGSTPLLTDLAGGQVELAFDLVPHVLPFIQGGRVRPIALAAGKRTSVFPEVPTITEAGVAGFEASGWHGFVVPAGTPKAVVDKLNREINQILTMDDVKDAFARQGVTPDGGTPAEFRAFIDGQLSLWKRVIERGAIKAD